mmetsp:Transcript_34404/g.74304  ORF Transcript_34404/g.74304 Transcript_34404/m.74304 type:complete len:108 (-) Transcript_34404:172-495(-)
MKPLSVFTKHLCCLCYAAVTSMSREFVGTYAYVAQHKLQMTSSPCSTKLSSVQSEWNTMTLDPSAASPFAMAAAVPEGVAVAATVAVAVAGAVEVAVAGAVAVRYGV